MKFKYILQLSFSNLLRRKGKTIISILIMTIALTIFLLTLSLSSSMSRYIDSNIQNNIGCRTLFVDYDYKQYSENQIIDIVSKYDHVSAAVPQGNLTQILKLNELVDKFQIPDMGNNNGEVTIKGANENTVPNIIAGRNFKDDETNAIIIPDKFIPDSRIEFIKNINSESVIDGKTLIGKKFTANVKTRENNVALHTFTVVGVFNAEESNENRDTLFVPFKNIDKVYRQLKGTSTEGFPIVVFVDSYKNVDNVIGELSRNNIRAFVKVELNKELPIYIGILGGGISAVVFMVALINIAITTINSIKDRTQEIGMLKAIGYKNKLVLAILNIETIIIGVAGFVIASVLSSGIIVFISKTTVGQQAVGNIHLSVNLIAILIALIVSIIVPVIACVFASMKTMKIQPSYAMKE